MSHPQDFTDVQFNSNLTPYRPEWTDHLGYMSGALPWIETKMIPGQTLHGVRLASGLPELFTLSRPADTKPDSAARSFKSLANIELTTFNGQLVQINHSRIDVYHDTSGLRERLKYRYRQHFVDDQPKWLLVSEKVEKTHEYLNDCPVMMNMFYPHVARVIHKAWRTFIGRVGEDTMNLPFDVKSLTIGRVSPATFQAEQVTPQMRSLFTDCSLLTKSHVGMRIVNVPAHEMPPKNMQVEFLRRILLLCYRISQSVPSTKAMSKEEWRLNLQRETMLWSLYPEVISLVLGDLLVD